jgi:hypothetical protein
MRPRERNVRIKHAAQRNSRNDRHQLASGLLSVFDLRDARGEPVMRSRRDDQQGRAITRTGRGRRQHVVDFNVPIRGERYAGWIRAVSRGVAETSAGTWCSTEKHSQNPLTAVGADDVTAGQYEAADINLKPAVNLHVGA